MMTLRYIQLGIDYVVMSRLAGNNCVYEVRVFHPIATYRNSVTYQGILSVLASLTFVEMGISP
jgi:hypothetical protein